MAMKSKNRGERNGSAKLTESQVQEIRARYWSAERPTQTALAVEYGVTRQTIWEIVRNKSWQ